MGLFFVQIIYLEDCMKQYLTIFETAEKLTISIPTLYRWASEKHIPHLKIGGRIFFDPDIIDNWVEQHAVAVQA